MKKLLIVLTLLCLAVLPVSLSAENNPNKQVYLLEINGVIGPATVDYFERSMDKANRASAAFILLRMDTPGGLDLSMRKIIKKIITSPIPVVTYVAPGGSRAASAGTYILYASHIAAMSPGTNLGAATPIQLIPMPGTTPDETNKHKGEDSEKAADKTTHPQTKAMKNDDASSKKIINDAVAYIESLAKMHGRNEKWAKKAVIEAASLSAEEALKENVIDIVATSQADLFKQLNGLTVEVLGTPVVLETVGLSVHELLPDWRNSVLQTLTNPNIAYILMLIGIYGLIFEFANPGAIVPGTVGAICLLLALFSFQVLPINYAGLALILLGIALMVAEAFQPSFGVLGIGGVISFATGSLILIDTDLPGYGIDIGVIAGFTISTAAFFILALGLVFKARRNPIVSGHEQMVGSECEAIDDFETTGRVLVHSELWMATATAPMKKGDRGRVEDIDGLILKVRPDK